MLTLTNGRKSVSCERCGEEFVVYRSRAVARYCSQRCYHAAQATHGHTVNGKASPTFRTWAGMISRCGNPKDDRFHDYGGRGIRVCDRWQVFAHFLEDMGERPDGMSLDRINNEGGYEPANCQWADRSQQQRNTRDNHLVEYDGREVCVARLAEDLGLKFSTLSTRIQRGWAPERWGQAPSRRLQHHPKRENRSASL